MNQWTKVLNWNSAREYFSSGSQNPTEYASVFDNSAEFLQSILENNTPTMLIYGGNYIKGHELRLEDAFPIQFPFGIGGLHTTRRVPVSSQCCIHKQTTSQCLCLLRSDHIWVWTSEATEQRAIVRKLHKAVCISVQTAFWNPIAPWTCAIISSENIVSFSCSNTMTFSHFLCFCLCPGGQLWLETFALVS